MSGMICETKGITAIEWNDDDYINGTACVVEYSRALMELVKKESCGKDVFCREGTWQISEIIADITNGKGEADDIDLVKELLELLSENINCRMSSSAAAQCLDLMNRYRDEWELHLRKKRCTNLICKPSFILYISPELCDGCEKCTSVCPVDAIAGGKDLIHVIDSETCTKCMKCVDICPKSAIKTVAASGLKPKVPEAPVPVGSFETDNKEENGYMRRRRRGE